MNIGDNLLCLGMVVCGAAVAITFLIMAGRKR